MNGFEMWRCEIIKRMIKWYYFGILKNRYKKNVKIFYSFVYLCFIFVKIIIIFVIKMFLFFVNYVNNIFFINDVMYM